MPALDLALPLSPSRQILQPWEKHQPNPEASLMIPLLFLPTRDSPRAGRRISEFGQGRKHRRVGLRDARNALDADSKVTTSQLVLLPFDIH
jgi:hypothetical protein